MNLEKMKEILNECWCKETCYGLLREYWSEENKTLGQCAITALVLNDYFDGEIMRCMVGNTSHYYNLIDEQVIDFTSEQFGDINPKYVNAEVRTKDYLLSNEDTRQRYEVLSERVRGMICKKKEKTI